MTKRGQALQTDSRETRHADLEECTDATAGGREIVYPLENQGLLLLHLCNGGQMHAGSVTYLPDSITREAPPQWSRQEQ